jgi:hypothetical protein
MDGLDGLKDPYLRGPPFCLSDTAEWARFHLAKFQSVMGTDAERARHGLGIDSTIDAPGGVDIVHDEEVCRAVSAVLDSTMFISPRHQAVLVFALPRKRPDNTGPGAYVVFPPPLAFGEWAVTFHLDERLRPYNSVYLR